VTWNQLGILSNPVVLFNIEGYWDGLLQWVQKAVGSGFIAEGNSSIMAEASSAREVLLKLNNYEAAEGRLQLDWEEQKD
jgi:predicted Rossmann-fold nucleotide-binding protein